MVREITTEEEFRDVTGQDRLTVVDFTASWCGPCQGAAPVFEEFSRRYTDVQFVKVTDDNGQELVHSQGVRAFPTFRLYHKGQLLDEVKGANMQQLESLIQQHKANIVPSFSGSGFSLGGSSAANAADAREARLRRLGLLGGGLEANPPPPPAPTAPAPPVTAPTAPAPTNDKPAPAPEPTPMAVDDDDYDEDDEALLARALKKHGLAGAGAAGSGGEGEGGTAVSEAVTMVEPEVDQTLLAQLLEFGFSEIRSKKGLLNGGGTVEGAVNWLTEHQDDPDIDDPIPLVPQLDLSGSGSGKRKLTLEELQARIAQRRQERAEAEKAAEIAREKARRESGKSVGKTKEELDRLQRQREAEQRRKEKEAYRLERERLRAEIAKDKAERAARSGVLPGRLDAEGYNPSGLQGAYGSSGPSGGGAASVTSPSGSKPSSSAPAEEGTPIERVDKAITIISRQKVAGAGGTALKTLLAYIKNIAENPAEEKFRSINTDNRAFRERVAPVVGSTSLLRAVGFDKDDANSRWVLPADKVDVALLNDTRAKLDAAFKAYTP